MLIVYSDIFPGRRIYFTTLKVANFGNSETPRKLLTNTAWTTRTNYVHFVTIQPVERATFQIYSKLFCVVGGSLGLQKAATVD